MLPEPPRRLAQSILLPIRRRPGADVILDGMGGRGAGIE